MLLKRVAAADASSLRAKVSAITPPIRGPVYTPSPATNYTDRLFEAADSHRKMPRAQPFRVIHTRAVHLACQLHTARRPTR